MARVAGPSRDELDARGDEFAARVSRAIRTTLRDVAATTRDVNDLARIQMIWRNVVTHALAPHLRTTWDTAVEGVRGQLEKINDRQRRSLLAAVFEIPRVSSPLAESFLADARNRLVAIGDVVWYTARGEMLTGLQLGEGVAELKDRVIASANLSTKRAEVIARTEVNSAMNNGAYEQMKALDVATVKEWIATDDSRTRKSHADVDGEEIDGDAKFMVGGSPMSHPHDPDAPPGETINCRCTLAWEIVGDEDDYEVELVAAGVKCHSFHLPGKHSQKTHGRGGSESDSTGADRVAAMKRAYESGYTVDREVESGASNADMAVLTLANGTQVVRKIDKKNLTRREYLANRVFDALKSGDNEGGVTTAQVDDDTIITTYLPGSTGGAVLSKINSSKLSYDEKEERVEKEHLRQAKLRGGKEIAMLDALTENHDRHSLNWILSSDEPAVDPIDQGAAKFEPSYMFNAQGGRDEIMPTSVFGDYWFGIDPFGSGAIDSTKPRYTQADITRYRAQVTRLSDEFQQGEERQWFDFMNRRLDQIEKRITS